MCIYFFKKTKYWKFCEEYIVICFEYILYSNCSCAVLFTCGDFRIVKVFFFFFLEILLIVLKFIFYCKKKIKEFLYWIKIVRDNCYVTGFHFINFIALKTRFNFRPEYKYKLELWKHMFELKQHQALDRKETKIIIGSNKPKEVKFSNKSIPKRIL
jgi:hypothetical protein